MATKAEVLAWMELWKQQELSHRAEIATVTVTAESDGMQAGFEAGVQAFASQGLFARVFKRNPLGGAS